MTRRLTPPLLAMMLLLCLMRWACSKPPCSSCARAHHSPSRSPRPGLSVSRVGSWVLPHGSCQVTALLRRLCTGWAPHFRHGWSRQLLRELAQASTALRLRCRSLCWSPRLRATSKPESARRLTQLFLTLRRLQESLHGCRRSQAARARTWQSYSVRVVTSGWTTGASVGKCCSTMARRTLWSPLLALSGWLSRCLRPHCSA
mmetsp:Transcript_70262/g.205487  ORF Transcript_70262/g.205487 Transcript_70262/m.205487 type:complete len:202 (+) Transcript_70262:340-945(+)